MRAVSHRCPSCHEYAVHLHHHGGTNAWGAEFDAPSTYECDECEWLVSDYTQEWDEYVRAQESLDEDVFKPGDDDGGRAA
jgi:hypothetical protein